MVSIRQTSRLVIAIVVALVLVPHVSAAQSSTTGAIAGVAKDTSGAVLPGVTVEAASPALIEKVRVAVTDGSGNFKITDLRPGTYTVTFTLTGFATFKREGIELSTGFTATANADMKVGALEETITVTGASPVVDIQNVRTQQVLKAAVLDALPAGTKNFMAFAGMTLGATASSAGRNDVGGDKGELSTGIQLHGGRGDDSKAQWDGMNTNVFFGNAGGQMRTYYYNTVGVEEVVVDTGGNSAENETGGANINMVPKEGGNVFKVYGAWSFTNNSLAAKAVSSSLTARGVSPQSSLKQIYDVGVGVGGPILKSKLWFYTPHRWWGSQSYGLGNYFNKSTNPLFYVPDLTRPAYADTYFRDNAVRLTWQASANHKLTQEEHLEYGCSCWQGIGAGALQAPETASDTSYGPQVLSQTTWSWTASKRLLVQAGATFLRQDVSFVNGSAANRSAFTAKGTPTFPGPNNFSITELTGVPGGAPAGYTYGALAGGIRSFGIDDDSNNFNQRFSVSYVTGSHGFKVGAQTLQGHYDINAMNYPGLNMVNYQFRGGVPASLTEFAGPFFSFLRIKSLGLYAQDQWTLKKLTLNLGVRYDGFQGRTLAFDVPAGPFVAARHVNELPNLPNFKDMTPRFGAAYDVFGNGKTAIKGSWGKYLFGQGGFLSEIVSPGVAIVTQVSRTWNDANGNYVPDCVLTNPQTNGECGTISNLAFGQPITNIAIADDARTGWGHREYNYQTSVQLQQQIASGFGVAVGFFHTSWGNLLVQKNTSVAASDFTEYCLTAPTDDRLGSVSGKQVCGFYDVNPNKFGQVNRLITLAKNFGKQQELYNGIDLSFNARWGQGALLTGGVSLGRETLDYCYANGRPDLVPENLPGAPQQFIATNNYPRTTDFCRVTSAWWNGIGSQIKLQAVYPLPLGFQLSGTFKNLAGFPRTANFVATNAAVAPSLGRNLSACPATGTCTATVTDQLLPVGYSTGQAAVAAAQFDERLNELDLRFTRITRFGHAKLQPALDIYNLFNNRSPQGLNPTYGAAWLRPTSLLGGRLLKFGVQIDY